MGFLLCHTVCKKYISELVKVISHHFLYNLKLCHKEINFTIGDWSIYVLLQLSLYLDFFTEGLSDCARYCFWTLSKSYVLLHHHLNQQYIIAFVCQL